MIDKETAEKAKAVILDCTRQLDESVKVALDGAPKAHSSMYRRLVGKVMGNLFTEVLMPLYTAYPDLEPEEVKRSRQMPVEGWIPAEVGAQLVEASSVAEKALGDLVSELSQMPEADSIKEGLRSSLTVLRDMQEFLRHACRRVAE